MQFRLIKRKNIKKKIIELKEEKVLFIHYSCESFYDITDGHTPRITSIAIRFLTTGTIKSFSIHKVAEKQGVLLEKIKDNYDVYEKNMLDEFFKFVEEYRGYIWIHWNMRDINYGFEAIKHRYQVLGGKIKTSFNILEDDKIDLSQVLIILYGEKYIEHPRLEKICELNKIGRKDFLAGKDEAKAFKEQKYLDLHRSTLRKVEIINRIFERIVNGDLRHKGKWKDVYSFSILGIKEYISENCIPLLIFNIFSFFLGVIATFFLTKILENIFNNN